MNKKRKIFNDDVLEFVSVANEFCLLVESAGTYTKADYIGKILYLASRLYYLAQLLPPIEPIHEEGNEKFVTERDWQNIRDQNQRLLGQHDEFLEVFDPRMQESETPVVCSISENMADIYQDIKDFVLLFQIGTPEVMNDALWECKQNFEEFWGQKLTNTLRALHHLAYGNIPLDEDKPPEPGDTQHTPDTSHWIISKRLEEYGHEEPL